MSVIEINRNPSTKDLRIFALLFLIFGGILGTMAWFRPEALEGVALVLGVSSLISAFLHYREKDFWYFVMLFAVVGGIVTGMTLTGQDKPVIVGALGGALAGVAFVGLASPKAIRPVYVGMILAVFPIGWLLSHVLLGIVLYLVLTPIGLLLRLAGKDLMQRKLEPNAKTYWETHTQVTDVSRYFKQF